MTLEEAIAEVKRTIVMDEPWSAEAVVLQAVASGDLIPRADAEAEVARLKEALGRIVEWSDAYPTQVFPEPDFARAAAALSAAGMSLDAVAASNMRYATKGCGDIARAALKGDTP